VAVGAVGVGEAELVAEDVEKAGAMFLALVRFRV
jgi:hypothetical protein